MRFDLPDTIIDNLVNCVDLKIGKNLCVTQRVYFSYIMSLQKPQPDLKAQTRGIGFCFHYFPVKVLGRRDFSADLPDTFFEFIGVCLSGPEEDLVQSSHFLLC